ncbi:hypothetical protein G3I60_08065 [Streptomyces sp. SID13666]|uniref:hypothetical protein n=1 Tax=unclassified Streptomyces TaxID=2593676 RepID=UPI0013BEC3A9|nr:MULTISPECIES: hypothetical protein [unclassified Streptomyces]NEA54110.1 hypothetical protein [Streptomyces sp. SID13666]NEA70207.1 hypothetical protein [Streptomyces sp. SID13588]
MTPKRRLLILATAVLLLAGLGIGLVLHAASRAYKKNQPQAGAGGTTDLWSVPADGAGTPRLLIPGASSPAPL